MRFGSAVETKWFVFCRRVLLERTSPSRVTRACCTPTATNKDSLNVFTDALSLHSLDDQCSQIIKLRHRSGKFRNCRIQLRNDCSGRHETVGAYNVFQPVFPKILTIVVLPLKEAVSDKHKHVPAFETERPRTGVVGARHQAQRETLSFVCTEAILSRRIKDQWPVAG